MSRKKPSPPPNSGRTALHQPSQKDRQMVEVMSGFGIDAAKIAMVVGIDRSTLLKHYRAEIDRGAATIEAKLTGNLLRIAGGSDNAALKAITFALQCRFGWHFAVDPSNPGRLGKKAAEQIAAERAGDSSDWGDDLRPARGMEN